MRLLFVARRFPPDVVSGSETVFARLLELARAAGHDVHLVCGYRTARDRVPADADAVDLRGRGVAAWPAMALAAARAARRWRPDAVLSNSIEVQVPGVPVVTLVHDLNFGGGAGGAGALLRRQFYRLQARRLAAVVAVSETTRTTLLAAGLPPERVVAIHNGVDIDHFVPSPRVPDAVVKLVQVSRILPGKGQHCALDALGRMRPDQRRGVHLDLVGTVADRVYADQLQVQAWGLPAALHFDVPDVLPWYQGADIALFPTRMAEGFGFAAVEAMACGLPVVGFHDAAVSEASGGLAQLVPRDDIVALRDAILALVADPTERRRRGDAGRAWVERYRWTEVWERYEALLARVLAEPA